MKYSPNIFVYLVLSFISLTSSARILALFPYVGKSHFDVFEPYVKELATRGHDVVVVSHFPQKSPIPNYTDVSLVGSIQTEAVGRVDLKKWTNEPLKTVINEWNGMMETCDKVLSFPAVQKLIASDETFDLVITETFVTDCFLPFVTKFKAPNIAVSSCVMFPWSNDRMGNPENPSYVPIHGSPFSDKMSFVERFLNVIINIGINSIFFIGENFVISDYVQKHFGADVPPLIDIARNTSLLLVNSHFSLNRPRPLVPGIVEVGGLHIKPPKKLPKDLEDYLNGAKHGVICFSMGSMIKGDTFPDEKRDAFLKAFAKLPQQVIWKWENDTVPGLPKNVRIAKWLPQFDILNHPNVRVFIGHGGLLGTIETIYAGVPMLGIPMFGDQHMNMRALENTGMAIPLKYGDITDENVLSALQKLLNEPSYRENAKIISKIYLDRPMSPMDTAIFWTEYVIRHKGAPHLRPASLDLTWYQYFLIDVIVVIFLSLLTVLLITFYAIRKVVRLCLPHNKIKHKQS